MKTDFVFNFFCRLALVGRSVCGPPLFFVQGIFLETAGT